jgi:Family of unknown function (DUF6345)
MGKAIMNKLKYVIAVSLTALISTINGFCQNSLLFTNVNATPEKSIILTWQSNTNEFYEIDYADSLLDTNTGFTTWKLLYDDFPSQGSTNTFWQDDGNFNLTPNVPRPKDSPMRFYRVSLGGTNTMNWDGLSVAITGLTNGTVLSGNITVNVAASTTEVFSGLILYLDGKEMPRSLDGSNFVFNSCETWNGPHTLFAVAKSQSGLEGFRLNGPMTYNHAVSSMVTISIQNLITDFAFSQTFFQPSLGQTQAVTANFTANCNWTLQILDSNSNAVRTVTGSGKSMGFNWDGTGQGGTNIPDAVYTYLLSASTNGAPMSLASPSVSSNVTNLWALEPGSESPVPFAIYPIGYNTNGMTIFKATQSQIDFLIGDTYSTSLSPSGGFFHPNDFGGAGSSQSTSDTGAKNAQGTIGVCYQRYLNPNIFTHAPPSHLISPPFKLYVGIDGQPAGNSPSSVSLPKILVLKKNCDDFCNSMQAAGYFRSFEYADDDVKITDLKKSSLGGNSIFNNVNLGMFWGHGSYGTTAESDGVTYTYVWIENLVATSITSMHLSDFDFGGTQPNGLRWMVFATCSALDKNAYDSMDTFSKLPINSNLHLLLGASTTIYFAPDLGQNYAKFLQSNTETIISAWNHTGSYTYSYQNGTNMTGIVKFAYSGSDNCTGDSLKSYEDPDGAITYAETKVYPTP